MGGLDDKWEVVGGCGVVGVGEGKVVVVVYTFFYL